MNIGEEDRQDLAAEVIELGESLFEAALDSGNHTSTEDEAYPREELRGAANEFFTALRLLLGIEQ